MKRRMFSSRPGVTLVELLLFMTLFAIIVTTTLPLLFRSSENRILQQTIALVEQNGTQILQNIGLRIRHAESILSPAVGASASWLALETEDDETHPTVIGIGDGAGQYPNRLLVIEGTHLEAVSSVQVALTDFTVRNTSANADRQSVEVSFTISRVIQLHLPRTYDRTFHATFSLFPDDISAWACPGSLPTCIAGNDPATPEAEASRVQWQVCFANGTIEGTAKAQVDCL